MKTNSVCVIICGGAPDFSRSDVPTGAFVICADKGLLYAQQMGIACDAAIGDFDSYGAAAPAFAKVLDTHKDDTDSEAALSLAIEKGFNNIIFLGATGNRIDHTLANIGLLLYARERGVKAVLVDSHTYISVVGGFEKVEAKVGETVSFIPIGEARGVTLKGFEYPTDNVDFLFSRTLGISNIVQNEVASVKIDSGNMIFIRNRLI